MKSHASEYLKLITNIYYDVCELCSVQPSDRDLKTIRSRIEDEGLSFLTITLPNFSRDFERSLELGFIDSSCFRNFKKHGRIPAFLQGIVSLVFNMETGRINDEFEISSSPAAFSSLIGGVRQICTSFKKIKLPCSEKRTRNALENFIAIEQSLEMFSMLREDIDAFASVSFMLWSRVLLDLQPSDAIPRHGPGATAEGYSSNEKYLLKRWHDRLEPYFPILGAGYPISAFETGGLSSVDFVPEDYEQPVKVITVPKTLKSPRIIAIEPCCMQFAQQGLRSMLYDALERSLTVGGRLNFTDQSINQRLAISSSRDGRLATIDLSEASDRVPWSLVKIMLRSNQDFLDAVDACRSRTAKVGDVCIPLRKFASMGSALCFPIEAMYFYTICVIGLLESRNLPVTFSNVLSCSKDVFVYGDDIIVPVSDVTVVLDYLAKYNCKVNTDKTFFSGKFRESCGTDAYNGYSVTPIYIRSIPPRTRQDTSSLISWNDTANLFFSKGLVRTSLYMFEHIERILGKLPSVRQESGVLGRNHYWHDNSKFYRYNRRLQRLEIKCWRPVPEYRKDILDGYPALSKSLQKLESLKDLSLTRDRLHLKRTARLHTVKLQYVGVSATSAELSTTSDK